ncbi:hypothetical protein [Candidatus Methanoperedens nitratireducens]|uniref:Uncharacterized protein n=1 Tax=Candidatus Methanoperedens nitratireducens TaxID=1392998 RepID=A0A284VSQ4_9EURY|nr:hypothetical protein [Candidatus Methanoperedens nitroreducens]SNQ62311.1 conserved hypothetical protein [Candidatus Methanoperedens nitroreducens]
MTICIASICENPQDPKIVFSADRMVTDSNGLTFEHGVPKISALTKNHFIMSAGRSSEADQIIQNVGAILSSYEEERLEYLTIKETVDLS